MQTFAIADLAMYPHVVADIRDNDIIIARSATWHSLERVRRKVCAEFGSVATTCQAPRTGAEIKRHAILRTTSRAIELGCEIRRARVAHEDTVAATIKAADGKLLFRGKVIDVPATSAASRVDFHARQMPRSRLAACAPCSVCRICSRWRWAVAPKSRTKDASSVPAVLDTG